MVYSETYDAEDLQEAKIVNTKYLFLIDVGLSYNYLFSTTDFYFVFLKTWIMLNYITGKKKYVNSKLFHFQNHNKSSHICNNNIQKSNNLY